MIENVVWTAGCSDRASVKKHASLGERTHRRQVVAHEEDRAARRRDVAHLAEALLLELRVADGEHLVDEQDLGLEVGGDGEREPHVHAARVALDRGVEEPLDAGEVDDGVELAVDLRRLMPRIEPLR